MTTATIAQPKGPRFDCCVGGWCYDEPYGWVICGEHEDTAEANGKPSDYWIGWYRAWQPMERM